MDSLGHTRVLSQVEQAVRLVVDPTVERGPGNPGVELDAVGGDRGVPLARVEEARHELRRPSVPLEDLVGHFVHLNEYDWPHRRSPHRHRLPLGAAGTAFFHPAAPAASILASLHAPVSGRVSREQKPLGGPTSSGRPRPSRTPPRRRAGATTLSRTISALRRWSSAV